MEHPDNRTEPTSRIRFRFSYLVGRRLFLQLSGGLKIVKTGTWTSDPQARTLCAIQQVVVRSMNSVRCLLISFASVRQRYCLQLNASIGLLAVWPFLLPSEGRGGTLTFWHRNFTFNSNKSPTWCNNFSVNYPDVCLQLNMFRAFSRPSSGAQWLQWQPLGFPSYRGDSRAVFVVGPAGPTTNTDLQTLNFIFKF
jgi:hypothetical protein